MQEIARSEGVSTKKDSQMVRQYVLQRGLRRLRFEVRRRNSDGLYFTVEGFFDGEEKKVDWEYCTMSRVKDMTEAVAKGELIVRKWHDEGWNVIYQAQRIPKAKR